MCVHFFFQKNFENFLEDNFETFYEVLLVKSIVFQSLINFRTLKPFVIPNNVTFSLRCVQFNLV